MKQALVVIAVFVILVVLLVLPTSRKPQQEEATSSSEPMKPGSAYPDRHEDVKATGDVFKIISQNKKFTVCAVREVLGLETPFSRVEDGTTAYRSELKYRPTLEFLAQHGYVRMLFVSQAPTYNIEQWVCGPNTGCFPTLHPGGYAPNGIVWRPTQKAENAIGSVIVEHRSPASNQVARMSQRSIEWDVILACRDLISVDAEMPLANSTKVDFTWRWAPTELGVSSGISHSPERGEAYLRPNGAEWIVENLYCKEEK